jgi:uncharacterized membrane protein
MTAPHAGQIISEYMSRLERALAHAPDPRRQELMDEVRAHIAEARRQLPNETDADLLNILDRLGDPAETAAAELGRTDVTPEHRSSSRALEIATIVLLLLFWPVGVVLLWMSEKWTVRDKLIGTLIPPGGYLGTLVVGAVLVWGTWMTLCQTMTDAAGNVISSNCPSGGQQIAIDVAAALLLIAYVVGPILSAGYLALRLQRRNRELSWTDGAEVGTAFVDAGNPL